MDWGVALLALMALVAAPNRIPAQREGPQTVEHERRPHIQVRPDPLAK